MPIERISRKDNLLLSSRVCVFSNTTRNYILDKLVFINDEDVVFLSILHVLRIIFTQRQLPCLFRNNLVETQCLLQCGLHPLYQDLAGIRCITCGIIIALGTKQISDDPIPHIRSSTARLNRIYNTSTIWLRYWCSTKKKLNRQINLEFKLQTKYGVPFHCCTDPVIQCVNKRKCCQQEQ